MKLGTGLPSSSHMKRISVLHSFSICRTDAYPLLHKGKQCYTQQLFRIILRAACSFALFSNKILFQVNMIQNLTERIYRIGNYYDF